MRLAKVEIDGAEVWTVLEGDTLHELTGSRFEPACGRPLAPLNNARLLAPIDPGNKVVGLFGNFSGRNGRKGPGLYIKPPSAITATGMPIVFPACVDTISFEAELAVVIGRRARNVPTERALDHVLGYTVGNDVTSFSALAEDGPTTYSSRFKLFDTFYPVGPWIDTAVDGDNLHLRSRLNGVLKQDISTAQMSFGVAETVAWVSSVMTLEPGDIISMGTPPGFGEMLPGDRIDCEVTEIGVLSNPVVRADAPG